jgi:SAM-dependent methyltransferase
MISYDGYNYSNFWEGREYEDGADKMAISALLSRIPKSYGSVVDVGGGMGRVVEVYAPRAEKIDIVDSSKEQLEQAHVRNDKVKNLNCSVGFVDKIPFPDESFDTMICIRVFHYIHDSEKALQEMSRVLKPGGHLILEIPNKHHAWNRIQRLLFWRRASSSNVPVSEDDFVNHDPREIAGVLKKNGFHVLEIRSVSNFRSPFLKKIFSASFLLRLERRLQRPLRNIWFGPSIYFFAEKENLK